MNYTIEHQSFGDKPQREEFAGDIATVRARAQILHHFNSVAVTVYQNDGERSFPICRVSDGRIVDVAPPAPSPSPIDTLDATFKRIAKKLGA